MKPALDQVDRDDAWVNGRIDRFRDLIAPTGPRPTGAGITSRMFGTKPRAGEGSAVTPRHLPKPWEVCVASADMLFGKPPAFTLHEDDESNEHAAEFLSRLTTSDEFAAMWHRAATYCNALGWVFPRLVWNQDISPDPWIEFVDADCAFAEWSFGQLTAVTFFEELPSPDGRKHDVWRLLQQHTKGRITYGLYCGTLDNLGRSVPFSEHPDTQHLVDLADADGGVETGIDDMTATIIQAREGAPQWRKKPQLKNLGQSDISAAGDVWAEIDKAWTELWHEVESARGRLLVSEELLRSNGPGLGQSFEWARDVFKVTAGASADERPTIEQVQFQLRVEKYVMALDAAERKAMDAVGLSPITMGQTDGTVAVTATEVAAHSRKTINTTAAKSRMWRRGGSQIITACVNMHAALSGYPPLTRPVNMSIAEPIEETQLDKANTVKAWRDADAASTLTVVTHLHPEWTPEQCKEEVARIMDERNPVDPFLLSPDQSPDEVGL